jgi:hypothetical protein
MKRKILISIVCLIFSGIVFGQKTLSPTINAFTRLSVFGNFDIELAKGTTESIVVESDEVDLSKISISQQGDMLRIKAAKMLFDKHRNIRVKITYVQLGFIRLNGGAVLTSADTLKGRAVKFMCRNGATANLKIDVENIFARLGQGATLGLEGKCSNVEVRAANGGLFNAYELSATNATMQANSGALIKIGTSKNLVASAVLGGNISYRGTPVLQVKRTTFGGSVERVIE